MDSGLASLSLGCPQLPSDAEAFSSSSALRWSDEACTWEAAAPQDYRRLQDVAYINHEGSSALSVYGLMLVYPLVICAQHSCSGPIQWLKTKGASALAALLDSACTVVPLALAFSTPHLLQLHLLVLATAAVLLETARRCLVRDVSWAAASNFTYIDVGDRLRFVSEYRAVVMASTCVAILAVDFASVFPRAQAKTEEFGCSLMDLGTGCIMCQTAVCSKQARRKAGESGCRSAVALFKRVVSLWPVLVLGFSRLALLRGIDYHVPTSEYGVHWNFFFTIAVVALVSTALDLGPAASGAAGLITVSSYQLYLSLFGGADFILEAPRVDLFSANREGILSCAGFLGLHWLAVALGSLITSGHRGAARTVQLLLLAAAATGAATGLLAVAGLRVSRRMCNLPYVLLTLSVNAWVLALLGLVDLVAGRPRPSMSLAFGGVQDSMLAVFLAANLLTGAVNVSMQPLLVPFGPALLVMAGYCLGWSVPFALLHAKGKKALKFW